MNDLVRLLKEEYEQKNFKLIRLRLHNGLHGFTIFLTDDTMFRYDANTNEVILGDCYLNNNVTSVRFKSKYITSLAVLKRR